MSTFSRRATDVSRETMVPDYADLELIGPRSGGAGETIGTLRQQELEQALRARRIAAGVAPLPAEADESYDLVGLALSGGGIRSAVYNLGFLQALSQRGLLRHVDYLCSVSGGGYIGGHLAALADHLGDQQLAERTRAGSPRGTGTERAERGAGPRPPVEQPLGFYDTPVEKNCPSKLADLGVDAQGKLLPEYRFRHVGEYLFYDPFQFVWRYLVCTVPMLLLALSSLGVLATLLAIVWRMFDPIPVRDVIRWTGISELGLAVGLGDELPIAFIPCLLPLMALLVGTFVYVTGAWGGWPRLRSWGNYVAKWSVMFGLFFGGCSLAIFLGNGETSFGGSLELVKVQSYLTWPLLMLTLLFLVPMVRFKSVVNSAREGAPAWQAVAARFVIGGACTLTPFFLVHWMGRENISGWAKYRDPELLREDVTQWPEYLHWRNELAAESSLFPVSGNEQAIIRGIKDIADYDIKQLGQLTHQRHARQFDFEHWGGFQRAWWLLEHAFRGENSVIGVGLAKLAAVREVKESEVADFNAYLNRDELTRLLHKELCDAAAEEPINGANANRSLSSADLQKFLDERVARLSKPEQDKFTAFWKRARGSEVDQQDNLSQLSELGWTPIEVKQFNRLLLEVLHPEFIRQRAMVSTLIVPVHDQWERGRWLGCWLTIMVLACLIDFNRTSPFFTYYRDRLHQRFLQMPKVLRAGSGDEVDHCPHHQRLEPDDHCSSRLSDLRPWRTGAPYPLFLGSLHLFDRVSPRGNAQGRDAVDADRCLPFLFSPLFCGSVYTGFRKTESYCQGELTVADAVAISGAAVTPFMTHNSGMLAMMAAFNLRIGKWLPRPDQALICGKVPVVRPLRVLWEWVKGFGKSYRDNWRYGLAADGGFHEFFGLEELLLRRCRLIIVSDAGCNNGKFEFGALADTIRLVRERHGIEFLDLDHDQPVDLARLRRDPDSKRQNQHHICLRARYPEDFPVSGPREAYVVYGQMSLTGDEPLDLQQFRQVNPNFPDEPTTNQSYDETQVESFRQLGFHVGDKICQRAPLRGSGSGEAAATPTSTELWIDWLRWGYTADCAQSAPLPINRLRQVDPRAEGLVFGPERDLRWRGWLEDARAGFNRYLSDSKTREQSLLRVAQLLGDEPVRSNTPLTAGELVSLILACHDLRADFPCANRRDLFEVGGRRHMIFAAAVAIAQLNDRDPKSSSGKKDKDMSDENHATLEARCKLAANFYRQLCRGVFSGGNSRTAALATLCLLEQVVLFEDRTPQWQQSLDCVAALVKLTDAGQLWIATDLILSWYQAPVAREAPPSSPTSVASEKTA